MKYSPSLNNRPLGERKTIVPLENEKKSPPWGTKKNPPLGNEKNRPLGVRKKIAPRYYSSSYKNSRSLHIRKSKRVLHSGFHASDSRYWIPDSNRFFFGFQILDYGFLVSGTWISDSNRFFELYSGFQSPASLIPKARISQIPSKAAISVVVKITKANG